MAAPRRFDPRRLRYDADWIPILSTTQLEGIATEVIEHYCPEVLKPNHPRKTPVLEILKGLTERTGLKFAYGDLGFRNGQKILGKVSFAQKTLFLDECLGSGPLAKRLQFTAAHEIGHWVLHRHSYPRWKFTIDRDGSLEDDDPSLHKLSDSSPRGWLEFQANVFASALIMPRVNFEFAVAKAQVSIGIRRQIGLVYLNGTPQSQLDKIRVIEKLEEIYHTSKQAIDIRLETLNLVETQPKIRPLRHAVNDWADLKDISAF